MPPSTSPAGLQENHSDFDKPARRKLTQSGSETCCSQVRVGCKRQRRRANCWIAVAIAASSAVLCFDSCLAFSQYHQRLPGFQRPSYRTTVKGTKLRDSTTNKRFQRHGIFSTLPTSNAQNHPHQNVQLQHSSNDGNNNQNHAAAPSSSEVTGTVFPVSDVGARNGHDTSEERSRQSLANHHQHQQQQSPDKHSTVVPIHDHLTFTDKLVVAATMLVGTLMFTGLVMASGPGAWRYYLSGGVCAATSHAIPTPIDVVKTRKQVDPTLRNKNFIEASKEIVQKEGVRALLAGLGPTTWGYLLEGAVKFGVYENLKPSLTRLVATAASYSTMLSFMDSQVFAFMLCGAVSGAAAAIAVCPMEALRIRLVAEPNFAPQGWLQGGYKILKYEGVSGLWKGMTPMLYKQVPYTVMKNVSFDFLTKLFYALIRTGGYAVTSTTKFTIPFLSAMIASILSCISSQPGDMLLSLVNAHEGNRRTTDFVQDILKSEQGFRGFFVGTKTRLLHVGVIVTLQLLVYDFVKRLCGIAATGSI